MDCLFIPPSGGAVLGPACQVHWQEASGEGRSLPLAECAALLQGRPVALVLPMEAASAFVVGLPTQKARLMHQALPYAVEEMLAEDVELFHLALGAQLADGRYPVLVLRRAQLAAWLEELEDFGVKVAAIHLDADLLPRDGEQLLVIGERALLGGACETRLAFPSRTGRPSAPCARRIPAAAGRRALPPARGRPRGCHRPGPGRVRAAQR